jgi:hypothetical protein
MADLRYPYAKRFAVSAFVISNSTRTLAYTINYKRRTLFQTCTKTSYKNCRLVIYNIWSKVSGHLLETIIRLSLWHTSQSAKLIPGGPTHCLYDSSNSAGETFYQVSERLRRNGTHSYYRAVARAVSDVGRWGLDRSRRSNSSHRCSMGVRSGLWAGQSISGTLLSTNHSLTDLALWNGPLSCWYRQLSSPKLSSIVDSRQRGKMSLYPSAFRFPRCITRGPSQFHENHPHAVMLPPPNFIVGH